MICYAFSIDKISMKDIVNKNIGYKNPKVNLDTVLTTFEKIYNITHESESESDSQESDSSTDEDYNGTGMVNVYYNKSKSLYEICVGFEIAKLSKYSELVTELEKLNIKSISNEHNLWTYCINKDEPMLNC